MLLSTLDEDLGMIPTYDDWREGLCEYLRVFDNAQQGYLRLQKLLLDRGHTISTHGIRGHHVGKYQDVGLTLARLVEECIAADGGRLTLDWIGEL